MALLTMSGKELGRLEALVDLDACRTTAAQAARLVGVSERHVFRLLRVYRTRGVEGLVQRRRGRPSTRRSRPRGWPSCTTSGSRARRCGSGWSGLPYGRELILELLVTRGGPSGTESRGAGHHGD